MLLRKHRDNDLTIFSVRPDAYDELAELYSYSIKCNPEGFIQDLEFHGPVEDICRHFQNSGGDMMSACLGHRLVGMGGLRRVDETRTELCKLHVHPEYQGFGYGRRISAALLRRAAELGFSTVELHVTKTQKAAIGLYETLGFRTVRESIYQTQINGQSLAFDTLYMERDVLL